jgi:hypothetical protein
LGVSLFFVCPESCAGFADLDFGEAAGFFLREGAVPAFTTAVFFFGVGATVAFDATGFFLDAALGAFVFATVGFFAVAAT